MDPAPGTGTPEMVSRPTSGFSLIELLVVIGIIIVLVAMLLPAAGIIRRGMQNSKTTQIMQTAAGAMRTRAAEQAGFPSPVEHPLAGTAIVGGARADFVRRSGATTTSIRLTGEALRPSDPGIVANAELDRIVTDDDIYRGRHDSPVVQAPALYGMPRRLIGILGAADHTITSYRRLPSRDSTWFATATGKLRTPYDGTIYSDGQFLYAPRLESGTTRAQVQDRTMRQALGEPGIQELNALRGLINGSSTTPLAGGRVVQNDEKDAAAPGSEWTPGQVREGSQWVSYRLPGLHIVDAWRREVLYCLDSNGGINMVSAGIDGSFRYLPGGDGEFQTEPWEDAPAGDDRDARSDNRSILMEK